MKNNNKKSESEKLQEDMQNILSKNYSNRLSENVKRALRMKKIRTFELKFGIDDRNELPADFVYRVKRYKQILNEVDKTNLEETLNAFKRDLYPTRELEIWESIAKYYSDVVKINPKMKLDQKKELFKKALVWTLG